MKTVSIEGIGRTAVAWALLATISACDDSLTGPVLAPDRSLEQRIEFRECDEHVLAGQTVWECLDLADIKNDIEVEFKELDDEPGSDRGSGGGAMIHPEAPKAVR